MPIRRAETAWSTVSGVLSVASSLGRLSAAEGSWFSMPLVPETEGLLGGSDDSVLAITSPVEGMGLFIHRQDAGAPSYLLEVTWQGDGTPLAACGIRFGTLTGERVLLVPLAGTATARSAALIEAAGFDPHMRWDLSAPFAADQAAFRELHVLAESVRSAASEATRNAWLAIGRGAGGDVQQTIEQELR